MSGIIGRLIRRARAPLSSVRPLLPSRFEADRGRPASGSERTGLAVHSRGMAPFEDAAPGSLREPPEDVATAPPMPGGDGGSAAGFGPAQVRGADAPMIPPRVAGAEAWKHSNRTLAPAEPIERMHDGGPAGRAFEAAASPDAARASGTAAGTGGAAPAGSTPAAIGQAFRADGGSPSPGKAGDGATSLDLPAISRPDTGPPPPMDARRVSAAPLHYPAREDTAREVARAGTTEVTISIGHIEVRAAPAAEPVRKPAARPRVTLDEYLRRHGPGER